MQRNRRFRFWRAARTGPGAALAVVVLLLLATDLGATEPQQRPLFHAEVELVRLQVMVQGPDGRFVPGLKAADFVLQINGSPRSIEVVDEVDLEAVAATARSRVAVSDPTAPAVAPAPVGPLDPWARRRFLILMDAVFARPDKFEVARRAALAFVRERLLPDDLVGLAVHRLDGLRLLVPFTEGHGEVASAIAGLRSRYSPSLARDASGPPDETFTQPDDLGGRRGGSSAAGLQIAGSLVPAAQTGYVEAVVGYLVGLRELGRALQAVPGRTHVLLFSQGFSDDLLQALPNQELEGELGRLLADPMADANPEPRIQKLLDQAAEALRDGNVAIHALSTSRLRPAGWADPARSNSGFVLGAGSLGLPRFGMASLWQLADETGGSLRFHTHHLESAVARIERITRSYYILAYRHHREDPAVVGVRVRTRRRDVKVTYAPTRIAPPSPFSQMTPLQRQLQLAGLLESRTGADTLAAHVEVVPASVTPERAVALVQLQVSRSEVRRIAQLRGDGKAEFEVVVLARRQGHSSIGGVISGTLQERDDRARFSGAFVLPPGSYELRVAVRESILGEIATRRLLVHLEPGPEDDSALGLGPVLVDVSAPDTAGARSVAVTVLAHHLRPHPFTGRVQAELQLILAGPDAGAIQLHQMRVIGHEFLRALDADLVRLRAPLPPGIDPGAYRLRVIATDPIAATERLVEVALGPDGRR